MHRGVLVLGAGIAPTLLTEFLDEDPFPGVHLGRNPLRVGLVMPAPLADRDDWFAIGQRGDMAACAVGELGPELLVQAYRG